MTNAKHRNRKLLDALTAGYNAAAEGKPRDANPHKQGSPERAEWFKGWDAWTKEQR